jgi:hypothetical protein
MGSFPETPSPGPAPLRLPPALLPRPPGYAFNYLVLDPALAFMELPVGGGHPRSIGLSPRRAWVGRTRMPQPVSPPLPWTQTMGEILGT